MNFNSSQVRLERLDVFIRNCIITISIPVRYDWNLDRSRSMLSLRYFNSSQVRLERLYPACLTFRRKIFQFQLGTIGTAFAANGISLAPNFNSSQVRLEQLELPEIGRLHIFQFQLGTIGTIEKRQGQKVACYFNSSQVRLEPRYSRLSCSQVPISIPVRYDWNLAMSFGFMTQ